jgi:hypothetical protein
LLDHRHVVASPAASELSRRDRQVNQWR